MKMLKRPNLRCALLLAPTLTLGLALASSCSGTAASGDKETDTTGAALSKKDSPKGMSANVAVPPITPSPNAVAITSLAWADTERIHLGYKDGTLATFDFATSTMSSRAVGKEPSAILAISPNGKLALMSAKPLVLFDTASNQPRIHFPDVKSPQSARFSPAGDIMVVAEKDGRIHLWQEKQFRRVNKGENLKSLLSRQNPYISTRFAPFSSPISITGRGNIVFSDRQGHVFTWDLALQQTFKVMKLKSPSRSLAGTGTHIFAASRDDELGVASVNPPRFEKWSRETMANAVAAAPGQSSAVVVASGEKLQLRDVKSGKTIWERKLRPGKPCGLSAASKGGPIAICIDKAITFLDSKTGAPSSVVQKVGSAITWSDANGDPIASK